MAEIRHGIVFIETTAALADTWRLSAKEIGREWLGYLAGKPSLFDQSCRFKERRPTKRPHHAEWRRARARIFERDGYACTYCGATDQPLHCDHVVAVVRGGGHGDDNLTTACQPCNLRKSARSVEEWRGGP